ncbi:hypothetical protein FBU30_000301 [Linnemannia zychae]|nr:hypothetical protein FBU30_000301 [Linnemannia zychae]
MPFNNKRPSLEKQKTLKGKDIVRDVSSEIPSDESFLRAFEASIHVFLNSHLTMDNPLLQLKIEHEDLDSQWSRFLNRTTLDLGLSHYIQVFRLQLEESASVNVDDPGMYWKTLIQIVCLVLALHIQDSQDVSNYSPVEDLLKRWGQTANAKQDEPINMERISDSVMTWILDVATQAANDINRLYGLYQNTLRLIILQIKEIIQKLNPPVCEDLVSDFMMDHNEQIAPLYQEFEQLGQSAFENINLDWFEESHGQAFGSAEFSEAGIHKVDKHSESRDTWISVSSLQYTVHIEHRKEDKEKNEVEVDHVVGQESTNQVKSIPQESRTESTSLPNMSTIEVDKENPQLSTNGVGHHIENVDNDRWKHGHTDMTTDKGVVESKAKSNDEESEEEEDEEEEPLTRRYLPSRQGFNPHIKLKNQESSSNHSARNVSSSHAKPGLDNVERADHNSSKPLQDNVIINQVQGSPDANQHTVSDNAATTTTTSAADFSIPLQSGSTLQQQAEQSDSSLQLIPSDSTEPTSQPISTDPQNSPSTTLAPSAARKTMAEPELQSEPDPFISHKKTKRIFRAPSESEFEDDGDPIPYRELKKPKAKAMQELPQNHFNPDNFQSHEANTSSNSSGPSGTTPQHSIAPVTNVAHILQASSRSIPPPSKRRLNRRWTAEEVARLMELAPRFLYNQGGTSSDSGRKKRKVNWAELKKEDERSGNILKHRTQVDLKDKYRQKTDNGKHQEEVNLINRTKSESKPQYQFPSTKNGL